MEIALRKSIRQSWKLGWVGGGGPNLVVVILWATVMDGDGIAVKEWWTGPVCLLSLIEEANLSLCLCGGVIRPSVRFGGRFEHSCCFFLVRAR